MIQEDLEKKESIDEKFENIDPELLKIMKRMLQFLPADRITAEECIASPYFDEIRNEKCE